MSFAHTYQATKQNSDAIGGQGIKEMLPHGKLQNSKCKQSPSVRIMVGEWKQKSD